jgi:imidazolonepropionase-like amidohydrolase
VASAGEAREAVRRLAGRGARMCKLAFDPRFAMLAPEAARAAADEAHRLGLLVAAHALEAESVRRALDAGADVLAHTPREELPRELLQGLRGKWVISTLHAFGTDPLRLRALHEAGLRIAYGTDLGNERTAPGIDPFELKLIAAAGVDPMQAAQGAADLLGLRFGAVGSPACLLGVRGLDADSLAAPAWVMNDGKMVS